MAVSRCIAVLVWIHVAAVAASAQQVVLVPDRDNTLIEHPQAWFSNGLGNAVYIGNANASNIYPIKRALLRFDIKGTIPPGSTIDSASLRIRVIKRNYFESVDRLATLHVVTSNWGEGTSNSRGGGGAAPTDGDATWLHTFYPDMLWNTPGGDFVDTESSSLMLGGPGHVTFESNLQMVADVQAWLDGSAGNFGWLMRGDETDTVVHTARKIGSREHHLAGYSPELTVDFTAPAEQACRWGTVDVAAAGTPQNVLTINGSAGDGGRVVNVGLSSAISVDLLASASGPEPGNYVLYAWAGEPNASTLAPMPKNLGTLCFPMLATGGDPQPLKTWNNIGRQNKLGTPDFPSTPAPSNVLNTPVGSDSPLTATLQGILLDDGSAADGPASITNAVVLRIE